MITLIEKAKSTHNLNKYEIISLLKNDDINQELLRQLMKSVKSI